MQRPRKLITNPSVKRLNFNGSQCTCNNTIQYIQCTASANMVDEVCICSPDPSITQSNSWIDCGHGLNCQYQPDYIIMVTSLRKPRYMLIVEVKCGINSNKSVIREKQWICKKFESCRQQVSHYGPIPRFLIALKHSVLKSNKNKKFVCEGASGVIADYIECERCNKNYCEIKFKLDSGFVRCGCLLC